jgi:hypothetical protein
MTESAARRDVAPRIETRTDIATPLVDGVVTSNDDDVL